MTTTMKAYIVAKTRAQYLDALRLLQLNERAAVHVKPGETVRAEGPVYVYANGEARHVEIARAA